MSQDLKFKNITRDNVHLCDPETERSLRISSPRELKAGSIAPGDWASEFLKAELKGEVPIEIRRLFEVARGAIIYGFYFYPLFTLGCEQLYRVIETAMNIWWKRSSSNTDQKIKGFHKRIEWLANKGRLTGKRLELWRGIKELRNSGSHPDDQRLWSPKEVGENLVGASFLLNELFTKGISG